MVSETISFEVKTIGAADAVKEFEEIAKALNKLVKDTAKTTKVMEGFRRGFFQMYMNVLGLAFSFSGLIRYVNAFTDAITSTTLSAMGLNSPLNELQAQLGAAQAGFMLSVGASEEFKNGMAGATEGVTNLYSNLEQILDAHPKLKEFFGAFTVWSKVLSPVVQMVFQLALFFGSLAMIFMAFGTPGLVVLGIIVAIIASLVLFIVKWKKLKKVAKAVWDLLKKLAGWLKDKFVAAWKYAKEKAVEYLNKIIEKVKGVIDKVKSAIHFVSRLFGGKGEEVEIKKNEVLEEKGASGTVVHIGHVTYQSTGTYDDFIAEMGTSSYRHETSGDVG